MDNTPFSELENCLKTHFDQMTKIGYLFTTNLDTDRLWDLYLSSFPEGTNPMFRKRTEHDCSVCRHFIKSVGNVVSIKDGVVTTLWDFEVPGRYGPVVQRLANFVREHTIGNVFLTKFETYGLKRNFENENGHMLQWDHFYLEVPANYNRDTLGTLLSQARATKEVLKRSLDEITSDATSTVLELIGQNSLYKGEEWQKQLIEFLKLQIKYRGLSNVRQQDIFCWEQSVIVGPVIGRIRNHSIGVLLTDISSGMDLDEAVRRYEKIVAPTNYKRPKAIFTQKMLKDAEETIRSLGYMDSLGRRFAKIGDISVNNVLFANRNVRPKMMGSVFEEMAKSVPVNTKKFDRIEEIPIERFIRDVLPTTQRIEVLLENRLSPNLVSLIAPTEQSVSGMFKWNNGFSWAYNGNITDSMKERVKSFGGNVTGVLRFSIQWNTNKDNFDDLDAHCVEPTGNHIYFVKKHYHKSSGDLDVDIIDPKSQTKDGIAVENITYQNLARMPDGVYKFFVHCYNSRGAKSGFTAEIEFNGEIYSFSYGPALHWNENIQVAEVTLKNGQFQIKELIPSQASSKKVWNLDSNQFHPVSMIMYSPNHWDGQGVGNRHVFFMLQNCINEDTPNGFFNEYLKEDLLKHKRVFEALGSRMRVEPSDDQLSGVGFSTTQKNYIVVRVKGSVDRILKVVV